MEYRHAFFVDQSGFAPENFTTFAAVLPVAEHPTPGSLNRLTHEYELKDDLDDAWAAQPLGLERERAQTMLVLKHVSLLKTPSI
jgi:hypothetical protein